MLSFPVFRKKSSSGFFKKNTDYLLSSVNEFRKHNALGWINSLSILLKTRFSKQAIQMLIKIDVFNLSDMFSFGSNAKDFKNNLWTLRL